MLAVNHPQLVSRLKKEKSLKITPASDVCYLDAVSGAIREDKPDLLILSAFLHGFDVQKYYESVFEARRSDVRVVLLAGSMDEGDPLLYKLVEMGVYDILFNPCSLSRIMDLIRNPKSFADVSGYFGGGEQSGTSQDLPKNESRFGFSKLKSKFMGNKDKAVPPVKKDDVLDARLSEGCDEKQMVAKEDADKKSSEGYTEQQLEKTASEDGVARNDVVVAIKSEVENDVICEDGDVKHVSVAQSRKERSMIGGKPYRDSRGIVVACCSPVPAGKTFVAVNLAAAAMKSGESVSLIDLDFKKRASYVWLNILEQPGGVYKLLGGDQGCGVQYRDMFVYGAAPSFKVSGGFSLPDIDGVLGNVKNKGLIVIDMPEELTPWHKTLLYGCDGVVVVSDPDCYGYEGVNHYMSTFKNSLLVVNKHVGLGGPFSYKDIFGVEPVVRIPLMEQVYRSILFGTPLVLLNPAVLKLFNVLYQRVMLHGRNSEPGNVRVLATQG